MKRTTLIQGILGLGMLLGMNGAALADFTCKPGSFLSIFDQANSDLSPFGPGPFAELCITLEDSTTADIQFATFNGFEVGNGNSLALNFGQLVTSSAITDNSVSTDPFTGTSDFPGGSQVDGFGKFDFHVSEQSFCATCGATSLSFTVTGTFTDVGSVLVLNPNFDAAAHIRPTVNNPNGITGFAGETGGTVIGETPEPGILTLLAIALVGMGWTIRRRTL